MGITEYALSFFLLINLGCAVMADNVLPIYRCKMLDETHYVNAVYDKASWQTSDEVIFRESENGKAATKLTKAKIGYDKKNLYIIYECMDTCIYGSMTKHDDPVFNEDVVEAFIAPNGLSRYFEINISPLNTVFDADIIFDKSLRGKVYKPELWNCAGLKTSVKVDGKVNDETVPDTKWCAEMAVPFESLGVQAPKRGDRWHINLYRIDRKPSPVEFQAWSPTMVDPAAFHVPSKFGILVFE